MASKPPLILRLLLRLMPHRTLDDALVPDLKAQQADSAAAQARDQARRQRLRGNYADYYRGEGEGNGCR